MAIVTLAEVKTYLKITDSSEDDFLTMLLADAVDVAQQYCRRRFEQATYTEYYSGTGTRMLVLRQRPVQSITSVYLDNNAFYGQGTDPFASNTLLTSGTDYSLELDETLSNGLVVSRAGLLVRTRTIWPELNPAYYPGRLTQEYGPAYGNIKVTYVAGYPSAAMPSDIKLAIRLLVSQQRQNAQYGHPLQSEQISDYNYQLAQGGEGSPPIIGSVRQILNRYREIPCGETTSSAPGGYGR